MSAASENGFAVLRNKFRSSPGILIAALALLVGSVGAAAASPAPAPASVAPHTDITGETFVIATDTTFAPFEYRRDGELTGIDMDLIRAVAQREGFTVEILSVGFDAAL
ncbi:extracellular solute-binding protein (family 3) [Cryobacterium psychrophilum]|nr:extracellular solute-binding protein (family 3) [Cryobacterium psychrophilum]